MYELNGQQFSIEELEVLAKNNSLTIDELFAKNPDLKQVQNVEKKQPQITGASVEETAAPDMESKSEPGFWESLGAQGARGWLSLASGAGKASQALMLSASSVIDFMQGKEKTTEEKQAFMEAMRYMPGSGGISLANIEDVEEKLSESVRDTGYESITDAIANLDFAAAAEMTAGAALESAPSLALAATGVGGLIGIGVSSGGAKFSDEFNEDPDQAVGKLFVNAAASGATEALFEKYTGQLLKGLKLVPPETAKQAAKTLSKSLGTSFVKTIGKAAASEYGSEAATQAAIIFEDYLILGKEKGLAQSLKEINDAGIVGGFTGGALGTVSAIGGKNTIARQRAERLLMTPQYTKRTKELEEVINKGYENLLSDETQEGKDLLLEEIKKAETELASIKKENSINLSFLQNEDLKTYAANADNIRKATKVIESDKSSEASKDLARTKINNLAQENNIILENAKKAKFEEITAKATKEAQEQGYDFKSFKTTEEFNKYKQDRFGKNSKVIQERQDGIFLSNPDGSIEILVDEETALKEGAVNVAAHELLHGVLFNTINKKPQAAINLGNALGEALTSIDVRQVADSKLRKRLELYADASEEIKAEELLTLTSDAIATGDLQFDENIFTRIGDVIRRTLQDLGLKQIKFNTGRDVYNFVKDYNKSLEKGKFAGAIKQGITQGFTGKLVDTKETKQAEQEIKESISANDKQNMMDLYNRQMEGVERTEYSKNNPLPARLENELVGKFYGYVNTLVNKKFRQVEEEAIEKEDAVAILMGEVVSAIRTFNPAKNDDISGYVASIIARRQSMVFQDVKQEFTEDVELSKEAQAITEETAPAGFTKKMQEANKKINLSEGLDTSIEIEGKSYETHVKDALSKAVARAVKKINEDVSANRTVTPFVESIKADMAQDLRKITKQFINEFGYEKFLIEHRELILNNFTTTYLAKHPLFRKGIEKSIGGKMITDNQGNKLFEPNFVLPKQTSPNKYEWVDEKGNKAKIDRDNAGVRGLTSGPEIMRRNKNIGEIITENEFVDYHFQDGAQRTKKKQNPEDALAMQIASEISFDYLKEDFLNEQEIFAKAQEYGEVLGIAIPDTQAEELAKDFDRGTIKYSISEKNMGWFINKSAENSDTDFLTSEINKKFAKDPIAREALLNFANEGPLWLAKLIQVKKELNLGIAYEEAINKILSGAVSAMKAKNITIQVEGRFDASAVDLVITHKSDPKNPIKIEIKLNQDAQMSSFTIIDIINFKASADNLPANVEDAITRSLEGKDKIIEKYNEAATKKAEELGFDVIQPGQKGNNTLFVKTHKDVFNSLKGDGFSGIAQKDLNIKVDLTDTSVVELLYKSKGVDYIQIGGKGLFFMNNSGKPNVFNAPLLSEAVENVTINIRPDRKTSKGISYFSYRAFPKFNGVKQSTVSLDNTSTIKKTLEKLNADKESPVIKQSISEADVTRVNDMISETGKVTKNEISEVTATRMAKNKGKFKFYVPPSADDFMGLMYYMARKGVVGDQDLEFIKEKLIKPFADAQAKFDSYKIQTLNDFRKFKKLIRKIPSAKLSAKNNLGFTNEEAVRVYLWSKKGVDIPGISKTEVKNLVKLVENNKDLFSFANNVSNLFAAEGYPNPQENWFGASMTIDILEHINETSRKEFFAKFTENAEALFGKLNNKGEISGPIANKLRAAYGDNYVEALSDVLYRMKNGRSREFGKNRLVNQLNNWISNSVGAVMFFNTRSALLQQVSMVNFINLSDNNPIKFAQAIANPKQYWADYLYLMNSDYLVSRRSGLKIDVNQDEIAKAAESGRNPVQSVISAILKKGFVLTSFGDSHAIATGGATFYRNRINTYLKDGLTKEEAEKKAFDDFKEISEESQQSSRPDRISQQQASTLGRIILAWANTPMQYARITKKATLDLLNRRGDWKTNMSKIVYYGTLQNLLFSYLQQGLFAMILDGEDDEEKDLERWEFTINSMADGFLRGLGYGGAIVSTAKNMVIEAIEQEKGRKDFDNVIWEALKISPPLGSKISKARSVGRTFGWKQNREKIFTEGVSLDNPVFEAVGKAVSATTNIPLDRVVRKLDNTTYPIRHDVEFWQAAALFLGWGQWELGLQDVKKVEKSNEKVKAMSAKEFAEYLRNKKK